MTKTINHPILVLIRGLPGSGKSYLTQALKTSITNELGAKAIVSLDPDATDYSSKKYLAHVKSQTAEGVDSKLHAYRFLRAQAHKGIESNKVIIWNQPFTNLEIFNKMIANLQGHAEEYHKQLPILVVEVEIDHQVAKKRVTSRKNQGGHGPSVNTFNRFIGDYISFAPYGYNTVTVNGQNEVSISVASVISRLRKLW